jgi:hypothetical protein
MMQRLFDTLVQFVQQGVAAVFRFVQFIWIWSIGQMTTLLNSPWDEWTWAKRGALALIVAILVYVLYYAAKDLWGAGQTILNAFGTLLSVVVRTLPKVLLAGLIALASAWVLNNVDFSRIYIPQYREPGNQSSNGGDDGNGRNGR